VTSIRERIRRLIRSPEENNSTTYAHKIQWTKEVRSWDEAKRQIVAERLRQELQGIKISEKIKITEIDEFPHSGASLQILQDVLNVFAEQNIFDGSK
jgi:hypothetical protein